MSIEARIKKVVVEKLAVDESKITPSAKFTDDLGADSLDVVELIMGLEEEFDLKIEDEVAESMSTVGDVQKYIEENTGKSK